MLCVTVVVVFLLRQSNAESVAVKYRCNDTGTDTYDSEYTRFYPSLDRVQGRYTAEVCTFNDPNRTKLTVDLTYREDLKYCDPEYRRTLRRIYRPGSQHSFNTVDVAGLTTSNCNHVCYSMDFDLIFSSCYLLKTSWSGAGRNYAPQSSYYLVNNNVTKDYYIKTVPYFAVTTNHDDYFTLKCILGIPAVDYNVKLRKINDETGAYEYWHEDIEVTQNCTVDEYDVRVLNCKFAPPHGYYQAVVKHGGLWTTGMFFYKKIVVIDFCCHRNITTTQRPDVQPSFIPSGPNTNKL